MTECRRSMTVAESSAIEGGRYRDLIDLKSHELALSNALNDHVLVHTEARAAAVNRSLAGGSTGFFAQTL